jgi:hypothetical protein
LGAPPNYQLIFEGVLGSSNLGDIALDEIKIIDNLDLCKPKVNASECVFTCKNKTCLTQDKVCNFIKDCEAGEEEINCGYDNITFEDGYKNWTEISSGSYVWNRTRSVDLSPLTSYPSIGI